MARKVHKIAPDVVGGELVQGVDAFGLTLTDEMGEFDFIVIFAGAGVRRRASQSNKNMSNASEKL
jgi:hypothetical protein